MPRKPSRRSLAGALALLACAPLFAQLNGVVDIHAHSGPDSVPRSIDADELVKLAKSRGMRGLLLKNHYESTASLAWIVKKQAPGLEVFGGIDLNRSVGGVNPAAIERMVLVEGGLGRVIWMPTFDAENQVRYSKENRPFVSVARNGELLPETKQVIALAAKHHLMLETGHSSAQEGLMIIREAKRQGVENVVVTHPLIAPVRMSIAQMKEAADLGAYLEFVYNGTLGKNPEYTLKQYADAIRQVGAKYCILSSDLGQAVNPLHPDGLVAYFAGLLKEGISQADIDLMSKTNPARVLGLK